MKNANILQIGEDNVKKLFVFSILTVLALILSACGGTAAASDSTATTAAGAPASPAEAVSLNGAGATFPLPVYTSWIDLYNKTVTSDVTINYQGIGSGGGKKAIIDHTVDFAGSDSLLSDEEYASGKDLQMYPTVAGAVVPIYNIDGVTANDPALVLSCDALAGIYSGALTHWNDPAITDLNPGLASKLPDAPITAVHRSDGSGTTEIFTKTLSACSADWEANVGGASAVEWPVDKNGSGVGGKGNQGVAATVQNTPNSVGYVELSYAVANTIPYAQMVNQAGKVVTADAASLQSAMSDFADSFSDKLTTTIVNGAGEGSWPIAGYTYLVLHTSMTDCAKANATLNFWQWALTNPEAAKVAADLGYAVLPDTVQTKVLDQMKQVTCGGQPVLK